MKSTVTIHKRKFVIATLIKIINNKSKKLSKMIGRIYYQVNTCILYFSICIKIEKCLFKAVNCKLVPACFKFIINPTYIHVNLTTYLCNDRW